MMLCLILLISLLSVVNHFNMMNFLKKFFTKKKKRRIIGYITTFPTLELFRRYLEGEITLEEYSNTKVNVVNAIPIYNDD